MNKTILAIAAAALSTGAILASPAAFAADARISWADLDLTTDAGKAKLAQRVDLASRRACQPQTVTGSHIPVGDVAQCRADVRAQVAQRFASDNVHVAFAH